MSVPLGSIFKLPAESWEEIEASEGRLFYWILQDLGTLF